LCTSACATSTLHATGQLAHIGIGLVGQAQAFQQLVNPGIVVTDAEVTGLKPQRLAHIEKGVKHQLLRHHAKFAAGLGIVGLHVAAHHFDIATAGAREARQNADHGGFACTIGAQQAKKLALRNIEADAIQCKKSGALGSAWRRIGFGNSLEGDSGHGSPLFYPAQSGAGQQALNPVERSQITQALGQTLHHKMFARTRAFTSQLQ
jgi:hypothetical protein